MSERSERVRSSVLDAAVGVLCDVGVQALTIEEVANRSGIAKTTIYRHWPSKPELILDAVASLSAPIPTPNTGDLMSDLRVCFSVVLDRTLQDRMGRILPALLDAAQRDPEYARLHDQMLAERQQPIRTILELAQLRGALPAGSDLGDVVEMLIGPLMIRGFMARREVTEEFVDLVIETVIAGLRAGRSDRAGTAGPV